MVVACEDAFSEHGRLAAKVSSSAAAALSTAKNSF